MKRIISLFIIFTLSVAFVGCSNNNKNYTSEELAQNLRLIKNNKNDSEGGTKFIDDNDSILTKVKEMDIVEFQKFASTYKSINFKKYTFVLFDEDILIIVKYSNDNSKIIDVKIMNNIIKDAINESWRDYREYSFGWIEAEPAHNYGWKEGYEWILTELSIQD